MSLIIGPRMRLLQSRFAFPAIRHHQWSEIGMLKCAWQVALNDKAHRHVSTWSPLAATFNAKATQRVRFNFDGRNKGLFGIDELRDPTGFYLLKERATEAADRLVAESCSPRRKRKMVVIFDELSDSLCQVADLAEFIRVAHPENKYVTAAEDACLSINALVERLNTNQELYQALRNVVQNGDIVPTDEVDKHVAKLFLFDFEQSGIHLDEKKRSRVVQLNECILQIGSLFMQSTSLGRSVHRDQLPENIRPFFASQGDKIIVSSLFADHSNEMVREAAYKIYMYPDSLQEQRLVNLLACRQELANICGFPSHSHRVLSGSLAGSPEVVVRFLDTLVNALKPYAEVDFQAMENLKQHKNPFSAESDQTLRMWDVPYLSAAIKNEKYNIDTSEYMPYFSLGTCMEGLNFLFQKLYGVTLELQEDSLTETLWSPDVHKLAVVHPSQGILGYIYCDFLDRPGKPNQDCHFTIRGGRELPDGSYQLPVVVLLLNIPAPTWSTPCVLTPGMVENLFHEMGHAMHSMLARTKYQHVTGTRCSTDFAEVPSILMEYFASDPRVLVQFARDYKTGKSIPEEMLRRLCHSKGALCASELQLQIFYAMLDQLYHGDLASLGLPSSVDGLQKSPTGIEHNTTTDVLTTVQQRYYSVPQVPHTAWQLRFGHLVGYGSKYYSYLMSKAVASSIWHRNFEADPLNRAAGERYRKQILAHGGGIPPNELLKRYFNENVTPEGLVKFLITEIDKKQKKYGRTL